jgi:hypothetical protein
MIWSHICNYKMVLSGMYHNLWLWFVNLDKNENEKCSHIIQQLMTFNNKWILFFYN